MSYYISRLKPLKDKTKDRLIIEWWWIQCADWKLLRSTYSKSKLTQNTAHFPFLTKFITHRIWRLKDNVGGSMSYEADKSKPMVHFLFFIYHYPSPPFFSRKCNFLLETQKSQPIFWTMSRRWKTDKFWWTSLCKNVNWEKNWSPTAPN